MAKLGHKHDAVECLKMIVCLLGFVLKSEPKRGKPFSSLCLEFEVMEVTSRSVGIYIILSRFDHMHQDATSVCAGLLRQTMGAGVLT